jgi:hypothetical protein
VETLAAAAVRAVVEMGLVVDAEVGRDAGDVIAPARQNRAYNRVVAGIRLRCASVG